MVERTQENTDFEPLCKDHKFMRVPRGLPCSASKEVGIGLIIDGDQLIFNDGKSDHYWQKRPVEHAQREHIATIFKNHGVMIVRH